MWFSMKSSESHAANREGSFNHFYCTDICDKLRKDLVKFTHIYLNVDEYWLTSSIPQQRFKLHILINYAVIPENVVSEV